MATREGNQKAVDNGELAEKTVKYWLKEGRLFDEVAELEGKVDAKTWQAIDSVRHVGNIGAHMEKDVNLIIDVDPEEAGGPGAADACRAHGPAATKGLTTYDSPGLR